MWQSYTYQGSTNSHPFFVYTPATYHVGKAVPLLVMLHGYTQTAEDFSASTRMNQPKGWSQSLDTSPWRKKQRAIENPLEGLKSKKRNDLM